MTKMNMACSGPSLIRFRMTYLQRRRIQEQLRYIHATKTQIQTVHTYTNCPTVRSAGTRYFFLSMSATSDLSFRSQITGIRSGYLARIREASPRLLSSECSCLNLPILSKESQLILDAAKQCQAQGYRVHEACKRGICRAGRRVPKYRPWEKAT